MLPVSGDIVGCHNLGVYRQPRMVVLNIPHWAGQHPRPHQRIIWPLMSPIAKASDTLGKPCPGGKSHQRLMELGIQLFHSELPLPVLESQGFLAAVEERGPRGLCPVHSLSSTASQRITGLGCGCNSSSSAPAVRPQGNRIIGSVLPRTPLCPNLLSFGFQNPDCIATHLERGKGEKSFLGCSGCVSSARP